MRKEKHIAVGLEGLVGFDLFLGYGKTHTNLNFKFGGFFVYVIMVNDIELNKTYNYTGFKTTRI